jgi:alanyl aminopeptidase
LPSYLVALAVGPFEAVSAGTSAHGVPLTIYALAGRAADAKTAAAITPKVFAWLENWFGMPFPYPKLDAVPIPITVGFGAMENPGMITYRADLVLIPEAAPETRHRTYAYYAAHEIAHQWFGDLVTPAWWDDLWLNESFATWLPGKAMVGLYPGWVEPTMLVEARGNSLYADSLGTVRRVREPIRTEHDIYSAFDGITYGKGAAVLRMFERHAGEDGFRRGVQKYLETHAHKTATAADFLAAVSAGTGTDVTTPMSTFLDQAGAPKLSASLTCDGDRAKIAITQARYLPLGAAPPPGPAPVWKVPVCVAYGARGAKAGAAGARRQVCGMVGEPTAVLEGDGCTPGGWLYANAGATGYYRTSIGDGLAALLADGWRHLDAGERLAVAQDVSAAVVTGEADIADVLALIPRLVVEPEGAATTLAVRTIESLERFLPVNDPAIQRWIRAQLGKRARALGWQPKRGESIHASDLREDLVPLVAGLGADPTLRKQAVALARDWRTLPETIRSDVMEVAVRGKPALADAWRDAYVAETDRMVRKDLARAIARVPDRARVEAALAIALDPKVDVRDAVRMVYEAAREPITQPWVEAWAVQNLDALIARIPPEVAADLVEVLVTSCDPDRVAPMRAVADAKLAPLPGGPRAVDQAFEALAQCIARRHALEPSLSAWRKTLR